MQLPSLSTLRDFWGRHPDAEQELREWAREVRKASWKTFHDVRRDLRRADNLGDGMVCFNIRRNDYRLIAVIVYDFKMALIKFVGTHADYDKLLKDKTWRKRL
jgi:mRNA interferase HigB